MSRPAINKQLVTENSLVSRHKTTSNAGSVVTKAIDAETKTEAAGFETEAKT